MDDDGGGGWWWRMNCEILCFEKLMSFLWFWIYGFEIELMR